jgi:hypothetical protein
MGDYLKEICVFRGRRRGDRVTVSVETGTATELLKHEVRHSPSGFEWGYSGSGPADLARSLCAHVLGHVPLTKVYQFVKDDLVAPIQTDRWELSFSAVMDSIARASGGAGVFTPGEGADAADE